MPFRPAKSLVFCWFQLRYLYPNQARETTPQAPSAALRFLLAPASGTAEPSMTMFGKEDLEGEVGIRIGGLRDAERAWDRTFTGTGHSQDLLPLELRHQPPSCLEINAKGLDEFLGNGHALLATGGHE